MTRLARTLSFSLYELKLMLGACAQLQSDDGGENVVQLLWWVRIVATFKIFREVAPKCQMSKVENFPRVRLNWMETCGKPETGKSRMMR